MNLTALQLFLYLNVFLLGVVCSFAAHHWYRHFWKKPDQHSKPQAALSYETKLELLRDAKKKYATALDKSTGSLENQLERTSLQLGELLNTYGTEIVKDETQLLRESFDKLRAKIEAAANDSRVGVSEKTAAFDAKIAELEKEFTLKLGEKRTQLEASMSAEINAEKTKLLAQLDTRLGDAMASFLSESLGHNVDLGAQTPYLIALLEEHKDELKKEVGYEAAVAK